jgi:hypothetical protein
LCYVIFLGFLLLLLILLIVLHVVQKFEETLKPILNVESMKECMNILLLPNAVFKLWQSVLLEWERCNILNGFGDVPACLPKPIGKSTFDCLANLKEAQLKKLARGFLVKTITLREHPTKGGRPKLKSMYEFTRLLKPKVVI